MKKSISTLTLLVALFYSYNANARPIIAEYSGDGKEKLTLTQDGQSTTQENKCHIEMNIENTDKNFSIPLMNFICKDQGQWSTDPIQLKRENDMLYLGDENVGSVNDKGVISFTLNLGRDVEWVETKWSPECQPLSIVNKRAHLSNKMSFSLNPISKNQYQLQRDSKEDFIQTSYVKPWPNCKAEARNSIINVNSQIDLTVTK